VIITYTVTNICSVCYVCVCVCVRVTVKAFLAQAKDDFNKKWDETAQVNVTIAQLTQARFD